MIGPAILEFLSERKPSWLTLGFEDGIGAATFCMDRFGQKR
jgi:hypothetical protein